MTAVNSTGEYRPWRAKAGEFQTEGHRTAEFLDPFIVLRQGTAKILSLRWGLDVPSSVSSSATLPYPFLKGSLIPALTTPTPCTHWQAHMQEGETSQSSVGTGWCKTTGAGASPYRLGLCFLFHSEAEALPLSQGNKRELNERQAQEVGHGRQRVPKGLR